MMTENRISELSVKNNGDYSELFQVLLNGNATRPDELTQGNQNGY